MDGLSAHCNTGIRNSQTEKVNDAFHKFEASLGGKMNCLWERENTKVQVKRRLQKTKKPFFGFGPEVKSRPSRYVLL